MMDDNSLVSYSNYGSTSSGSQMNNDDPQWDDLIFESDILDLLCNKTSSPTGTAGLLLSHLLYDEHLSNGFDSFSRLQ